MVKLVSLLKSANLVKLVSSVKLYCSDPKVLSVAPVTHEVWPCSRSQLALLNQLFFTQTYLQFAVGWTLGKLYFVVWIAG